MNYPNNHWHSLPVPEVWEKLQTSRTGLSAAVAAERLAQYGSNELPARGRVHPALIFLRQFKNILVYILIVAAAISWWFGHLLDTYVILGIVVLNAIIGFVQEYRADQAIAALKKLIIAQAKCYRDGEVVQLPARELVPGDIILLEEGDRVPADARLSEATGCRAVEASLTGESLPVEKHTEALPGETALADRRNMVWMSTFLASGTARGVVVATGLSTAIGQVATLMAQVKPAPSHFERKSRELVRHMGAVALVGAAVTFGVGFFLRGLGFVDIFLFSVATLVSAIPEGLPAVLTIVLAVGAYRMARRRAIIRTLPTTETLGVATVIITDKTGTLTENTLRVATVVLGSGEEITVTGIGWEPHGNFQEQIPGGERRDLIPLENPALDRLLHIALLCNNAELVKEENDGYKIIGDPTEGALVVLAEKAGLKREVVEESERRLADLPFNSDRKYRASLIEEAKDGGRRYLYAVGAPEVLLARCQNVLVGAGEQVLDLAARQHLEQKVEALSGEAMRVIALAYRAADTPITDVADTFVESLTLVGLVGMMDPPRAEVSAAVARARGAGIRVIMATGDHAATGLAIGKRIGLVKEGEPALTETELAALDPAGFARAVNTVSIFARLTPARKLQIAELLQRQGEIVAMTGDGVNDAPALKRADIGIAMGVVGTDVAREASHLILADDNFASIVNAIEEGRIVFDNTRKASYYLLTTNFAEMATIVVTLFLGFPLPLLPIHVLWLNLVTDGFNTVGLALEPGAADALREPPKHKDEPILTRSIFPFLILMTIIMVALTIAAFRWYLPQGINSARTAAFVIMSLTQIINVWNLRSLKHSCFSRALPRNPWVPLTVLASVMLMAVVLYVPLLQRVFRFTAPGAGELVLAALLSSLVLVGGEFYKLILRRSQKAAVV
ncbi:MAG: HAD-IC family P-type ATPase [Candidatus Magasanikbacteria bacterium]|nr:HAD-IC family P-type ATPase [Candidatus Magasanikbacteria bacterium]